MPALFFLLFLLLQPERRRIDAITLPAFARTIRKYVSKMPTTTRTTDFGTLLQPGIVLCCGNSIFIRWFRITRPARSRIEFILGSKQFHSATGAEVHPLLVTVPIGVCKRRFRSASPEYIKLFRRQCALPFSIGALQRFVQHGKSIAYDSRSHDLPTPNLPISYTFPECPNTQEIHRIPSHFQHCRITVVADERAQRSANHAVIMK